MSANGVFECGGLRPWVLAARPRTLFAALVPVTLGSVIAWTAGGFALPPAIGALAAALLIQIGTNFANDYWDWKKGADSDGRLGPQRVTASGLLRPRAVLLATCLVFAAASAIGLLLVLRGGWPILLIGVLAVTCGFLYTAGPYPLAYLGLGELFVIIFFGPVATAGTFYVQALEWNPAAFWCGLIPGFHATALLVVNNLRDRREDARHAKRTLAVRFGPGFARAEYLLCILVPLLIPVVLAATRHGPELLWLVSLAGSIPSLWIAARFLRTPEGAELNAYLGLTGRLANAYALVFIIAWLALSE